MESIMPMDAVTKYKHTVMEQAYHLIIHGFPERIVELNEMLSTPMFSDEEPPKPPIGGTYVMSLAVGAVPSNKPQCDMIKVIKPVLVKLLQDSNLLRMGITFMIPKIEDGNNFGVAVQESILDEIQAVESIMSMCFDAIALYFETRAEIVSKVHRNPRIDDYRRAIVELDEYTNINLRWIMCRVKNSYLSLHDIIIKNMEKLKKPRSSNAESLY